MGSFTSGLTRGVISSPPTGPDSYPEYVSSAVEALHKDFMTSVCALLLQHGLFWQRRRKDPPIHFRKPDHLYKLIDYRLRETGVGHTQLLELLRRILYFCPTFSHPYYMYQLLAGLDPYSVIGDFVASAVPSTMHSYRDGPVYYIMEEEISRALRQLIGYPEGTGDCIFTPGCAIANIFSILLARHHRFPDSKQKGMMHLPRFAMFVSQDCHACIQKGCIYTSVGLDNIYFVQSGERGRMSVPHLEKCVADCIAANKIPLYVSATSGSNALGAFDNIEEISKVCKKHNMWLHSDAALGAGVIVSETHRKRIKGLELCDSVGGNFHKLGSATQVSSFLLTPHTNIYKEALATGHRCDDFCTLEESGDNDFFHSERDTFDKYIDLTRRPDICKLFMMWKGKGLNGLGANVDDAYERSKFLLEELKRRQKLNGKYSPLLEEFESPVIPFYYVPTYLQKDRFSPEFKERLNMVMHTSFLLAELINKGVMVVTTQSLRGSPLFFKMNTFNSSLTAKDLVYLLDQIDNYGTYLRVPFEVPNPIRADPEANRGSLEMPKLLPAV